MALVKSKAAFVRDVTERVGNTFWQGALGVLVLSQPTTNWSELRSIGYAAIGGGIAAVGSLVKSYLVRNRGVKNSASASKSV